MNGNVSLKSILTPVLCLLPMADIHELLDDPSLPCATLQCHKRRPWSQVDDSTLLAPWAVRGRDAKPRELAREGVKPVED